MDTIASFIENEETDLNPLVALAHFYISQQSCLIGVERWKDPMIQRLYRHAQDVIGDVVTASESTVAALQTALKYADDGAEYCHRLKRKYDHIAEAEDDDPLTPMEEPSELSTTVHNPNRSNESD
ncbi:hypothetical protein DFQ29_005185 [Apophysomyces sp. BC1021]|nr:hypothetical protein DFQ29_005185 [Apophysomyces sp. BC1021]